MKNTALTSTHIELNAKMVPFAGYNMPVSYEGVNAEHETVRKAVGVFDVSHMGEFLDHRRKCSGTYPKDKLQRCFQTYRWQSSIQLYAQQRRWYC